MDIYGQIQKALDDLAFCQSGGKISSALLLPCDKEGRGDLTTNVAFSLAKIGQKSAPEIAKWMVEQLTDIPCLEKAVASGGFVNFFVVEQAWPMVLKTVLKQGQNYGHTHQGMGQKVNIEYVSANPTGPLHAGHCRGAVLGDVLARLLKATGFDVVREYFINDAGGQIKILSRSVYARYTALIKGQVFEPIAGLYPGEYLNDIAQKLVNDCGNRFIDQAENIWIDLFADLTIDSLMKEIRNDLKDMGITHEIFTSEKELVARGLVDQVVSLFQEKNLVYEGTLPAPSGIQDKDWSPQPLLLFRSTLFGDEQDRPLTKGDGSWTYFAGDCAYHWDKLMRGFDVLIDIFGADHISHMLRTKAAVRAITQNKTDPEILICQIVNFFSDGAPIKISKRAGTFITVRDILNEIDISSLRFMMASKKADTHFDFDFEQVKRQTKDNPVFYVQYAYARCCSVMRGAVEHMGPSITKDLSQASLDLLCQTHTPLLRLIADWPRQLQEGALTREPHRITNYLYRLAASFHILWQTGKQATILRFIQPDDLALTRAHLALIEGLRLTMLSAFNILGIQAHEQMH